MKTKAKTTRTKVRKNPKTTARNSPGYTARRRLGPFSGRAFCLRYNWDMIRRNYIQTSDVADSTEAQVALAEELIDAYVGPQDKSMPRVVRGEVSQALVQTIYDTDAGSSLGVIDGYYTACVIELIGGVGAGQSRIISASSRDARSVTYSGSPFSPAPGAGTIFKIYQLAKFPRCKDEVRSRDGLTIYKSIPEAVKQACIAQVKFIQSKPTGWFESDKAGIESETIGDYSYSKGQNASTRAPIVDQVGPQARALLRGIKNSGGRIVAENPTDGY